LKIEERVRIILNSDQIKPEDLEFYRCDLCDELIFPVFCWGCTNNDERIETHVCEICIHRVPQLG